ncbi:porin, partial [uncultured Litoreibacter sp.]|uniref:porin n=1 Tax=uncultured Litoreibacter sp. TaxID=1392394 RepID=UPI002603A578
MKKVLFASTALVAFGGAAVADVALSGRAEMGIFSQNAAFQGVAPAGAADGVQFFTDIDVTFTMSGETDNGLTFGASVDLDEGGAISNA